MTCRDDVLSAIHALTEGQHDVTFTAPQVVAHLRRRGTAYKELTIRSYISGTLCAPEPDPKGKRTHDLVRVGRGQYRLR